MNRDLPQNRKVKKTRPRDASPTLTRGRGGGKLRILLRRVGHWLWPERFPGVASVSTPVQARGFIWVWALSVMLAAAAFVTHLHVRFEIIQSGYTLSQAQAEQRRQRLAQRELRLELATIKEPGRIERQAREMLNMDRPEHDRIVRLGESSRLARGR